MERVSVIPQSSCRHRARLDAGVNCALATVSPVLFRIKSIKLDNTIVRIRSALTDLPEISIFYPSRKSIFDLMADLK